jgi:Tol biopolymer transport system component
MQSGRLTKLVDGLNGRLSSLGFTNHGAAIQFVTSPLKDPANRRLFTTSAAGGPVKKIPQSFQGPVSLSASGLQAAFYFSNMDQGADELFTLDVNSGARHRLAFYKYPLRFAWNCNPAWSSDGKQIAFPTEERDEGGFLIRLNVLDATTGARHTVASPRWQWVQSIAWTRNNSALAVVGQEHESSFQQIWYVPYPGSRDPARRIGNNLDEYIGASLDERGSEMVSVQSQTLSNIYVANQNDFSNPVQVTAGSGRHFDLAWMPDGRILYASDATGSADLWIMNPDGTGQRQLTFGAGRSYGPAASPDWRTIVFHSNRSGNWQVWRTDVDGMRPKQLSNSARDGNWPQFSADGKTVLFHRSSPDGLFNLWQVPAEGGTARQFTAAMTMHPAVARASGQVAAWYSERTDTPQWKIGIFAPNGGAPLRVLNPTADARPDTPIRWMPKENALSSLDYAHSASNIWMLPVDGHPPRPLTSFDSGEIYSFDGRPKENLSILAD